MQETVLVTNAPYFLILHLRQQRVYTIIARPCGIDAIADISQYDANNLLVSTIDQVLTACSLTLENISAIGVSRGPGQFITLRAMLVTAQGFNFARKIPLIGLAPMELAAQAHHSPGYDGTVWVEPTHRNEVTLTIYQPGSPALWLCLPIDAVALQLNTHFPSRPRLQWAGSGVVPLIPTLGTWYRQSDGHPSVIAHELLVDAVVTAWNTHTFDTQLTPIYSRAAQPVQ